MNGDAGNKVNPISVGDTPRSVTATASSPKSAKSGTSDAGAGGQRKMVSIFTAPKPKEKWWRTCSYKIVENTYVIIFTMFLTFWALVGDDLRLIYSTKEQNPFFDWLVVFTMAVFGTELVLSCLGKPEYFMGFFFWLDLLSTISLILDISIISKALTDAMSGGDDDGEAGSTIRSGRSARLGARLGRILRVLRLIRILKLQKAYVQNQQKKKKAVEEEAALQASGAMVPWKIKEVEKQKPGARISQHPEAFEEEEQAEAEVKDADSNVGKALSEQTTRKTILLILVMLLVLPFLSVAEGDQAGTSAEYGANDVYDTLVKAMNPPADGLDHSAIYQQTLLRYVFYTNWFAGNYPDKFCSQSKDVGTCTASKSTHLFWIGVQSKVESTAVSIANASRLTSTQVDIFAAEQANVDPSSQFMFGSMPSEAMAILKNPWNVACDTKTTFYRGFSLLGQEIPGVVDDVVTCPDKLREAELGITVPMTLTVNEGKDWTLIFYYDQRQHTHKDSTFNLITVAFILFLLILGALMFSADADRLVVIPVEKMIKSVKRIRNDPLVATIIADDEFKKEEERKDRLKRGRAKTFLSFLSKLVTCQVCMKERKEPLETVILEKTVIKLGSLLALGLGEAGANIIRSNIAGSESTMINAMVPGTRVECVVGVVRVVDFGIATEVLQGQVNTFANRIAEIVHGVCDEFHGAPNKNNGDTFLIIWRVDYSDNPAMHARNAKMAFLAFTKVQGAVHRSPVLAAYRSHPGLQFRLGKRCRVNLSMSLHAGWAIEGAVGSEFKIDASYLSPCVRMAQDMEAVIESYGVSMAVSQSIIDLCDAQLAQNCRMIDILRIRGVSQAAQLYALDLDHKRVELDPALGKFNWNMEKRFRARRFIQVQKAVIKKGDTNLAQVFADDVVIQTMRKPYTQQFFQNFRMGLLNYISGEWQIARNKLELTLNMLEHEDGPSQALLAYMKDEFNFVKPDWWDGVHEPPGGPEEQL